MANPRIQAFDESDVLITTLEFGDVDIGQDSELKTIRFYNDKGGTLGSTELRSAKLTISDVSGGQTVTGTPSNGNQPFMLARCTTMVASSVGEAIGVGNNSKVTFDMLYGANDKYVANSGVFWVEKDGSASVDSAGPTGTWTLAVKQDADEDNPLASIVSLGAQWTVGSTVYNETYVVNGTETLVGSWFTLDEVANSGKDAPPLGATVDAAYTYYDNLSTGEFSVSASSDPAQVTFTVAPGSNKKVKGSYNYDYVSSTFERIGGTTYQLDIGARTTTIGSAVDGSANVEVAEIDQDQYAEVELYLSVPSDASNVETNFKVKVLGKAVQ